MQQPRIVVFRPGALGDTILSIDALAALRSAFPEAMLELVGNREAGSLLAEAGIVDVVTSFETTAVTDLFRTPARVAPGWRDAERVVLWLKGGEPIAEAFRTAGVLLTLAPYMEPSEGHMADHLVRSLAPLGIGTPRPPLFHGLARLRTTLRSDDTARAHEQSCVLFHPGSGSPRKNWPPERFADLARHLVRERGRQIALLVGPADRGPVQAVASVLDADGIHLPFVVPSSLRDLASHLAAADLVVGNDSGVSHLSAALGTPTMAIFGPTDPVRWAPRGARVVGPAGDEPWPTVRQVATEIDRLSISNQDQPGAQYQRDQ